MISTIWLQGTNDVEMDLMNELKETKNKIWFQHFLSSFSFLSFEQMGEGSSAATTTVGVVMTFKRRHTTKLFDFFFF
jgi:hypothetical protein